MESILVSNENRKLTPPMCGNPRPFFHTRKTKDPEDLTKAVLSILESNNGVYVETHDMDIISKFVLDLPNKKIRVCLATSCLCIGLYDLVRKQDKSLEVGYAVDNVINYSDSDSVVFLTPRYLSKVIDCDYLLMDERIIYENTLLPSGCKHIIITRSKITPLPYPSIDLFERQHTVSRYYFENPTIDLIASIIEREKGSKGVIYCKQPDMFILKNIFPLMKICETGEMVEDMDYVIDFSPSSKGESLYRVNVLGQKKEGRVYTLLSPEQYKNLPSYSIVPSPPVFQKRLSDKVLEEDVKNYYYLRVALAIDCMIFAFSSNPFLTEENEKFFGPTMVHTYTNLFLYLINDLKRMTKQNSESKGRSFTLKTDNLVDDMINTDKSSVYTLDQKTGIIGRSTDIEIDDKIPFTHSTEWYVHSWCEDNGIKEEEILSFLKIFNSEEIELNRRYTWYQTIQGWNPLLDFELYDDVSNYLVDVARKTFSSEYVISQKDGLLLYGNSLLSRVLLTTDDRKPVFSSIGTEAKNSELFPSFSLYTFMIPKEDIDTKVILDEQIMKDSVVENIEIVVSAIDISRYALTIFPSTLFASSKKDILEYIKESPIPLYMGKGLNYVVEDVYSRSFSKQERGRIVCYIRFLNRFKAIKGLRVLIVGIPIGVASYLANLYPSSQFHIYDTKEDQVYPENLIFHELPFEKDYDILLSGIRTGSSEHFADQSKKDMEYQYNLVETVKPKISSLIRLVPEKDKDFDSYIGNILIVPWSERGSRESFIEIESGAKKTKYKGSYYDNYLRFINLLRKEGNYKSDIVGGKCSDSCYDCTSEKMAFSDLRSSKDVSMDMNKLSEVVFDDLCLEQHK